LIFFPRLLALRNPQYFAGPQFSLSFSLCCRRFPLGISSTFRCRRNSRLFLISPEFPCRRRWHLFSHWKVWAPLRVFHDPWWKFLVSVVVSARRFFPFLNLRRRLSPPNLELPPAPFCFRFFPFSVYLRSLYLARRCVIDVFSSSLPRMTGPPGRTPVSRGARCLPAAVFSPVSFVSGSALPLCNRGCSQ